MTKQEKERKKLLVLHRVGKEGMTDKSFDRGRATMEESDQTERKTILAAGSHIGLEGGDGASVSFSSTIKVEEHQ